jgi:PAS domain S-box-containing protein
MRTARGKQKAASLDELTALRQRVAELEELLRESQRDRESFEERDRQYRSVFNTAGSVILCLDSEGRILEWNRAAERLYGRPKAEVLGENYLELFIPEPIRESIALDIAKVLDGEPTEGFENLVRAQSGEKRLLLWNVSRLADATGKPRGIVAVGQDITDRARAEAERRHLEIQLQEARKLESLEALAGGIAHEFNTVLIRILESAARARVIRGGDETVAGLVRDIERAAHSAIDVANQMLTYAGHHIDIYAVFLNRQIEEAAPLLQAVIPERVRLEYRLAAELPPIMAHPGHLQQMAINLVTNAADALANRAGTVTIATGRITADRPYLQTCYLAESLAEGTFTYLEVTDDGVGMGTDVQAKMFDPFFSTNVPRRGLGLAAVLGIVRAHRGAIRVDSAPGEGTRIRVLFPEPEQVPFASERPKDVMPAGD